MPSDLHVILGASGHVGSVAASRLLQAGKRVRVVARNVAKLSDFASKGAEVVPGSVDDAPFLRRAFDGAKAAFVLIPPRFEPGFRAWQDRVAATIGDALEAAGVEYAVVLSSIGADLATGNGPVAGLHVLERRLERIGSLAPLFLRPGYFFENHLGSIGLIRKAGTNGGALRPDLPIPQIAAHDIGEVVAERLLALDWKTRTVQELQGQRDLTMAEVTSALGHAIGRHELRYVQFPYADAEKGMVQAGIPGEHAALYAEMAKGFNEGKVRATQSRSRATTTSTAIERWATEVFAPAWRTSEPATEPATAHP
jgi:uncharacterized protein YbjT (DUF2867 family)